MFVKTQYENIVNIANCVEIKLEFYKPSDVTENTSHQIIAVFEDREKTLIYFMITPNMTDETKDQLYDQTQKAYNQLHRSLFNGDNAFDMLPYVRPSNYEHLKPNPIHS